MDRFLKLPNEKETVYGASYKWIAWKTEFPLIAAAKAFKISRQQRLWTRVIQVRLQRERERDEEEIDMNAYRSVITLMST
ncbi:hypothetical protein P3L10_005275 [Capsicum annuum]